MKDRNKDYWHERINNIFDRSIRENEIAEIYRGQYRDIEKKIIELYNRAVKQKIVTRTDLYSFYSFQKLLKGIEKQNKDIKAKLCRETVLTLQRAYKETFSSVTEMLDGDSHWGVQNEEMLKSVLNTKWEGNNFSSRIWENTEKLSQRIKADVTTAIVQGTGKDTLVKNIMRDYNVGFSKADRLVRTETMHAINQAQLDTYAKEGVEEVEWNAGFDERMCDICGSMHGRKYKIGEAPTLMHPNCRCTLVPVIPDNWFDDEYLEERDKKKRGLSQIHPKKAVAANKRAEIHKDVLNKTVDKGDKSGIMGNVKNKSGVTDVHYIGKIDREIYKCVSENRILSDDVIITDNRIQHIIERRGQAFYEKYKTKFSNIISDPDYIFADKMINTAIVSKTFKEDGISVNIVLRVIVEGENPDYKNSIITAIKENDKRFEQRLRNNNFLYKRLDNSE